MSSPIQLTYDGIVIEPAPVVSINKEYIYSNDIIIGYTYIFNLQGYASSKNKKLSLKAGSLKSVIQAIDDVQDILRKNGKILKLTCAGEGEDLIVAYGGHLRSFDVQESDNKWINYAQYTAQIEFTRVIFGTQANIDIDPDTYILNFGNELLQLKNFSDKWNFSMSEEDLYKYYSLTKNLGGQNKTFAEDYSQINIEYTVSATGKHYYYDNSLTRPAWATAKEFVQKRLYDQINLLYSGSPMGYWTFPNINYDSRDTDETAPELSKVMSSSDIGVGAHPILSSNLATFYKPFNEKITCTTSESDGSFSATYTCILKYFSDTSSLPNPVDQNGVPTNNIVLCNMDFATHSFDVTYDKTRSFESTQTAITVNGTITGLLQTNILLGNLADGQVFNLPLNGPFLNTNLDIGTKYYNALTSFNNRVVTADHTDLNSIMKHRLEINLQTLFPWVTSPNPCNNPAPMVLRLTEPKSFQISHDYNGGSITYTAEYDADRACAINRGFETLTITEEDSVPILAEFVVPGRSKVEKDVDGVEKRLPKGPIFQYLGTNTHKKITLEFTGTTRKGCDTGTPWAPHFSGVTVCETGKNGIVTCTTAGGICDTDYYVHMPKNVELMIAQTEHWAASQKQGLIPVSHSKNYNPVDGSYSYNISYIVCPYDPDAPIPDHADIQHGALVLTNNDPRIQALNTSRVPPSTHPMYW